jgi:hypothetical protein
MTVRGDSEVVRGEVTKPDEDAALLQAATSPANAKARQRAMVCSAMAIE